jgi:hypothetical protein
MSEPSVRNRIEKALQEDLLLDALVGLAKVFKAEGMSQREMYDLFDEYREKHEMDREDTLYDAILYTMGVISGRCDVNARLFEWELEI